MASFIIILQKFSFNLFSIRLSHNTPEHFAILAKLLYFYVSHLSLLFNFHYHVQSILDSGIGLFALFFQLQWLLILYFVFYHYFYTPYIHF